jgi:hypothetical protein
MTAASAASLAGVLTAIDRLVEVIERESAALAAGEREPLRRLLDDKRGACRAYEEAVRAMTGTDSDAVDMDDASRRALQPALERLGRASAENRRRLAAAIAAHKRLLDVAATAMRELSASAGGYARSGAPARAAVVSLAPPALSLNRAL